MVYAQVRSCVSQSFGLEIPLLGAQRLCSGNASEFAPDPQDTKRRGLLANPNMFACFEHRAAKIFVLITLAVTRAA